MRQLVGRRMDPVVRQKNRFAFDEESGFVIDRETGEWLTTAEEVFDAMIQHMPNPAVEGRTAKGQQT